MEVHMQLKLHYMQNSRSVWMKGHELLWYDWRSWMYLKLDEISVIQFFWRLGKHLHLQIGKQKLLRSQRITAVPRHCPNPFLADKIIKRLYLYTVNTTADNVWRGTD